MSVENLFPGGSFRVTEAYECARCGALVRPLATLRHSRWHAAVDTAATTLLPSEPKGQS